MRIDQQCGIGQATYPRSQRIGGVKLPDFSEYEHLTKTEPAMSEDKYREAIIEQAKKDFAAGKFQTDSAGFRSLEKSYASVVSPDRKGILTSGLTAVYRNVKLAPDPVSLIELLLGDGSIKYDMSGKELTYAEFYDSNGNMVASYDRDKWQSFYTPDEIARKVEMATIYNKAWGDAKRAAQAPQAGNSSENSLDEMV